jgi:hypothetical protein
MLTDDHMTATQGVVERLGGITAGSLFKRLFSKGYPKKMLSVVASLAKQCKQREPEALLLQVVS